MGSTIPFQPLVGSDDSDTARYPTDPFFSSAMTPNQRPESGSYSRRGSFSLGKSNVGLAAFQNSRLGHLPHDLAGFLVVNDDIGIREVHDVVWPHGPRVVGAVLRPRPGRTGERGEDLDLCSDTPEPARGANASSAIFDKVVITVLSSA